MTRFTLTITGNARDEETAESITRALETLLPHLCDSVPGVPLVVRESSMRDCDWHHGPIPAGMYRHRTHDGYVFCQECWDGVACRVCMDSDTGMRCSWGVRSCVMPHNWMGCNLAEYMADGTDPYPLTGFTEDDLVPVPRPVQMRVLTQEVVRGDVLDEIAPNKTVWTRNITANGSYIVFRDENNNLIARLPYDSEVNITRMEES